GAAREERAFAGAPWGQPPSAAPVCGKGHRRPPAVSKLPETANAPSAEIASARTGPPWPRNCACADTPASTVPKISAKTSATANGARLILIRQSRRCDWVSWLRRTHAQRANLGARAFVAQGGEEGLHGRALTAAFDQQEIVVFGCDREEAEPVELRNRLDRNAPVGTALRDGGSDRVVRARLVAVAGRPRTLEQPVDQHTRAGAGLAVDHQAGGIRERGLDRLGGASTLEARVAGPIDDALHALPPLHQREAGLHEVAVVDAGRGIEQVGRGEIAFAALRRGDAAEASYCDR